ncbi:cob(I)yrinic acid a,c-diamide adenosyltransferase, partial [Candidatus Bathyarchaeota archaeon ex4484_205]
MLGLVHVYTGNGKGKTTSALGLALRASGHEMRTLFVQFLKGRESGEVKALKGNKFIDIETFGTGEFFTESKRDLFLEYCR